MKWKFLIFTCFAAFLSLSWIFFKSEDRYTTTNERVLISMRRIGHEILLQSGDSSSRVLPIEHPDPSIFIIKFENPFFFEPGTLAKLVNQHLKTSSLKQQYLVEVMDCQDNKKVFYSYEVSQTLKESNIPCVKRKQPLGCYAIKIKFTKEETSSFLNDHYLAILAPSVLILLLVIGWKQAGKNRASNLSSEEMETEGFILIGKLHFFPEKQILKHSTKRIELSSKESKLLKVFALKLNEIIDRDQLLKEVWEDDGVFVGRSLDVFVSKLRKKLQADPSIRIVNIHGKGYKLEI